MKKYKISFGMVSNFGGNEVEMITDIDPNNDLQAFVDELINKMDEGEINDCGCLLDIEEMEIQIKNGDLFEDMILQGGNGGMALIHDGIFYCEEISDLENELVECIENMNRDEQAYLVSEYCEFTNNYDSRPECTESINDLYSGYTPLEILDKLDGFDISWDYFYFDGYGRPCEWTNIESSSSIDEIVEYIVGHETSLENDEIQAILEDWNIL